MISLADQVSSAAFIVNRRRICQFPLRETCSIRVKVFAT
jgi:hypothetical protein